MVTLGLAFNIIADAESRVRGVVWIIVALLLGAWGLSRILKDGKDREEKREIERLQRRIQKKKLEEQLDDDD